MTLFYLFFSVVKTSKVYFVLFIIKTVMTKLNIFCFRVIDLEHPKLIYLNYFSIIQNVLRSCIINSLKSLNIINLHPQRVNY